MAAAVFLAPLCASAAQLPSEPVVQTPVAVAVPAATTPPPTDAPTDEPLKFPLHAAWTATLADFPSFPPAYDTGFGYFALRNDQLVAVSLEDGKPAWSVECPTSSAPAAGSGLVFTSGGAGIESRPVWKPMHMQPLYSRAERYGGRIAEDLFRRGICLPSSSSLRPDEQRHVINQVLRACVLRGPVHAADYSGRPHALAEVHPGS